MAKQSLPLIVEPKVLEKQLGAENLLIVDLSRSEIYDQGHIPGAAHIDYAQIIAARPPAMGELPSESQLNEIFSSIGMQPEQHIVAYDNEGGGRASRLLWTLDVVGHVNKSLLNGGWQAWVNDNLPISTEPVMRPRSQYPVTFLDSVVADKSYIMDHLKDPGVVILDARTQAEYSGELKRANRTGHIPGAVNFEWTQAIDQANNLRLKSAEELKQVLSQMGVTPDKEVIAYCHTHHRSAHTYIVLKNLGYTRIRGYPGSWSEWGNLTETPVE